MKKNLKELKEITIDLNIKKYLQTHLDNEDLNILSKISNGKGGFNISKIFPSKILPKYLQSILKPSKIPMLISFYHVGWHDDKNYATQTYPWFAIYVLETHNKEYFLEIGKRGGTESVKLSPGKLYLINTRIKHRIRYEGEVDGKPCSLLVLNTSFRV